MPIEIGAEAALLKSRRDWHTIQSKWGAYSPQAYNFVREGLQHTCAAIHGKEEIVQSTPEMRHVNGGQLCAGLRDFAILRYGLLARTVLNSWNIHTTEDFGRIVFSLIDLGMLRRNDDDCVEDFIDVYGFNETFADLAALAAHGD